MEHHEIFFTPAEGLEAIKEAIYHMESYDVIIVRGAVGMVFIGILFRKWRSDYHVASINRSTEGLSKLKSPETRQVQERLVSTLEHLQAPKWDRTRCPEE